ncbi:hypothetical protein ACJJTC_013771 [Scirpophaga incertulas]
MKRLKKSLVRKVQYLFENITSIHGINHLNNERGIRLALWIVLLLLNLMVTVFFIIIARQKYYDDQTVTAINGSCTINTVPFPTVSICNINLVSLKDIRYIKNLLIHYNRTEEEIIDFFQALPRLNTYSIYIGKKRNFTEIMTILKRHYFTMDTIMEEIHQRCTDLLVACSFNRKTKVCGEIFYKIKTFEGFCCAFNYAALNDASESAQAPHDNDFDYYEDISNDKGASGRLISTSQSGRLSGLFVVIDVEPNEYPPWSLTPFFGAKILVSDPADYPETTVKYRFVAPGEVMSVKVQPMVYQTSEGLRRLDAAMRRCWFHDEVSLAHSNRYSFETCHTECRMDMFMKRCNCIPYKYPRGPQIVFIGLVVYLIFIMYFLIRVRVVFKITLKNFEIVFKFSVEISRAHRADVSQADEDHGSLQSIHTECSNVVGPSDGCRRFYTEVVSQ